jgi:hypothetical protein
VLCKVANLLQTPPAGLLLVSELDAKVGLVDSLDERIGALKQRDRGVSGGQLLVAWAEMMLAGGDFMCSHPAEAGLRCGAREKRGRRCGAVEGARGMTAGRAMPDAQLL